MHIVPLTTLSNPHLRLDRCIQDTRDGIGLWKIWLHDVHDRIDSSELPMDKRLDYHAN